MFHFSCGLKSRRKFFIACSEMTIYQTCFFRSRDIGHFLYLCFMNFFVGVWNSRNNFQTDSILSLFEIFHNATNSSNRNFKSHSNLSFSKSFENLKEVFLKLIPLRFSAPEFSRFLPNSPTLFRGIVYSMYCIICSSTNSLCKFVSRLSSCLQVLEENFPK